MFDPIDQFYIPSAWYLISPNRRCYISPSLFHYEERFGVFDPSNPPDCVTEEVGSQLKRRGGIKVVANAVGKNLVKLGEGGLKAGKIAFNKE
jgi:hypothetical protein